MEMGFCFDLWFYMHPWLCQNICSANIIEVQTGETRKVRQSMNVLLIVVTSELSHQLFTSVLHISFFTSVLHISSSHQLFTSVLTISSFTSAVHISSFTSALHISSSQKIEQIHQSLCDMLGILRVSSYTSLCSPSRRRPSWGFPATQDVGQKTNPESQQAVCCSYTKLPVCVVCVCLCCSNACLKGD